MRSIILFALAVALSVVLCGCGSPGYAARIESDTDLAGFDPQSTGPYTFAVGNDGKPVQQLVMAVNTSGTLSIRKVTAAMSIDANITKLDYSKGPLYLPPHPVRAQLMEHHRFTWVWNLGDLPTGYHEVAWFKARQLKALPHRGHVIEVAWYALTSPDQPRSTWQRIATMWANV